MTFAKRKQYGYTVIISLIICLILHSCKRDECHQKIYIYNNSSTPITVRLLWTLIVDNDSILLNAHLNGVTTPTADRHVFYYLRNEAEDAVIFPNKESYIDLDMYYRRYCIETEIDWSKTHEYYRYILFICDTFKPTEKTFLDTSSAIDHFNVLERVDLYKIGITGLRNNDFTITYQ